MPVLQGVAELCATLAYFAVLQRKHPVEDVDKLFKVLTSGKLVRYVGEPMVNQFRWSFIDHLRIEQPWSSGVSPPHEYKDPFLKEMGGSGYGGLRLSNFISPAIGSYAQRIDPTMGGKCKELYGSSSCMKARFKFSKMMHFIPCCKASDGLHDVPSSIDDSTLGDLSCEDTPKEYGSMAYMNGWMMVEHRPLDLDHGYNDFQDIIIVARGRVGQGDIGMGLFFLSMGEFKQRFRIFRKDQFIRAFNFNT